MRSRRAPYSLEAAGMKKICIYFLESDSMLTVSNHIGHSTGYSKNHMASITAGANRMKPVGQNMFSVIILSCINDLCKHHRFFKQWQHIFGYVRSRLFPKNFIVIPIRITAATRWWSMAHGTVWRWKSGAADDHTYANITSTAIMTSFVTSLVVVFDIFCWIQSVGLRLFLFATSDTHEVDRSYDEYNENYNSRDRSVNPNLKMANLDWPVTFY